MRGILRKRARPVPQTVNVDEQESAVGLCAACRHVRMLRSDRGSLFYQCQRSFADSAFPRYPPLPVLHCRGFEGHISGAPQKFDR
jgi:hypothetical protein